MIETIVLVLWVDIFLEMNDVMNKSPIINTNNIIVIIKVLIIRAEISSLLKHVVLVLLLEESQFTSGFANIDTIIIIVKYIDMRFILTW